MRLITSKRFLPLFITQFLGAFNDNLLKNALVVLIIYRIAIQTGENAQALVTIAAGLFILPFFLFSYLSGQVADKFERTKIVRWIKLAEIFIMLLASLGFIFANSYFLIAVLFAAGIHSTFFGPLKYVLVRDHLKDNELLKGNAYIEAGTFLAILLGTITGGIFILKLGGVYIVSALLCFFAISGYFASRFIPLAPAPEPQLKFNYNIWSETIKILKFAAKNQRVYICILGISWFWLVGATFLAQFPSFVKNYLHAEAAVVTLFLTLFSVGIGIGSYLCNKLLCGVTKNNYVPLAGIFMSVFILDLYFASQSTNYNDLPALLDYQAFIHMPSSWRIMFDILLLAIFGGLYTVPLYASVQLYSDNNKRARIIAANNILNALFMVISAIFTLMMLAISFTIAKVFLVVGAINLIIALMLKKSLVCD